jgi:hypothetical protein
LNVSSHEGKQASNGDLWARRASHQTTHGQGKNDKGGGRSARSRVSFWRKQKRVSLDPPSGSHGRRGRRRPGSVERAVPLFSSYQHTPHCPELARPVFVIIATEMASARTPAADTRTSAYQIRASVLDAALAIGLGETNVDHWLYHGEEPEVSSDLFLDFLVANSSWLPIPAGCTYACVDFVKYSLGRVWLIYTPRECSEN